MSPRRSLTASLQVRANYSGILLRDYNADPGLRGASRVARASQPSRANVRRRSSPNYQTGCPSKTSLLVSLRTSDPSGRIR